MTFSLCHASKRLAPTTEHWWRSAAEAWLDRACHPENIEHVLCLDPGDRDRIEGWPVFSRSRIVRNTASLPGAAEPWNCAAMSASGDVLISLADDWHPCQAWDTELLDRIPDVTAEHAVWVRTAGDGPDPLMFFNIVTRPYFHRLIREHNYAGLFHPGYIGMLADNDFTLLTQKLDREQPGLLIQAQDLFFQHFHPEYGTAAWDDVYNSQHRVEAYNVGAALLEKREANGFRD